MLKSSYGQLCEKFGLLRIAERAFWDSLTPTQQDEVEAAYLSLTAEIGSMFEESIFEELLTYAPELLAHSLAGRWHEVARRLNPSGPGRTLAYPLKNAATAELMINIETILQLLTRPPIEPAPSAPPPIAATIVNARRQPPWSREDDDQWTNIVAREFVIVRWEEFYNSTHWALLKEVFLTGVCAMCAAADGRRTTLHHRTYQRVGQERREDLTEICHECHERYHRSAYRRAA
jgi:hypothetical protein